jgi:hypothetical protein
MTLAEGQELNEFGVPYVRLSWPTWIVPTIMNRPIPLHRFGRRVSAGVPACGERTMVRWRTTVRTGIS